MHKTALAAAKPLARQPVTAGLWPGIRCSSEGHQKQSRVSACSQRLSLVAARVTCKQRWSHCCAGQLVLRAKPAEAAGCTCFCGANAACASPCGKTGASIGLSGGAVSIVSSSTTVVEHLSAWLLGCSLYRLSRSRSLSLPALGCSRYLLSLSRSLQQIAMRNGQEEQPASQPAHRAASSSSSGLPVSVSVTIPVRGPAFPVSRAAGTRSAVSAEQAASPLSVPSAAAAHLLVPFACLGGGPGSGAPAVSRLAKVSFSSLSFSCAKHHALHSTRLRPTISTGNARASRQAPVVAPVFVISHARLLAVDDDA